MNIKPVLADFQFLGNRVNRLVIDTKVIDEMSHVEMAFDYDYEIKDLLQEDDKWLGILQFIVKAKAKVKNRILFRIDLEIEGVFAGNADKITQEKFSEMLEINGLITLLHIARAYLVSVTAQSGIHPPVQIPMVNILKMREKKNK
jgi:preprotein translocase subunit SecB